LFELTSTAVTGGLTDLSEPAGIGVVTFVKVLVPSPDAGVQRVAIEAVRRFFGRAQIAADKLARNICIFVLRNLYSIGVA